jgi:multidrug efflux pump
MGAVPEDVQVTFAGEDADQREAATFLMTAFGVAIFLMFIILVTQFNSIYQALLVLSAIVLSTAGVLVGLLVNGQSFGIVMVGMGLIALAGIVVNNNIILIDTYNQLRRQGLEPHAAALETGSLRLRPVLLTAVTTILGLMPMVLSVNVDLLTPSLGFGAPSTQWWTQLSSAIAGGLSFATVLTLLLTPCLLVLGSRFERRPPPLETFDDDLLDLPEHLLAAKPSKASLSNQTIRT